MTDFNLSDPPGNDAATETNTIVSQLHGGGGGDDEFDLTLATPTKKALPLQAISVGLVLLVGAGSLYLMRRAGTRAGIDFSTTEVINPHDTTIEKFDNEEEIPRALEPRMPEQVPKDQVRGDVFQIAKDGSGDTGTATPFMDPAKVAAERLRVETQEALGRLQVESVMHGRIPIAKISGKLYRIDDTLGGKDGKLFTVVRIEDRSVFLQTVNQQEFELSMVN